MARQALRDNHDLSRFTIEGEANSRQLGTGSYGSVEEIITNGLVCAGKKLHEVLLDPGNEGVRDIAGRYVQECQLMSDLRHPNITLFLGVCFLPDCQLPVLLMERLDGSLDDLLETVPNIPLVLKRSMLEDVSRGLLYLHKHTPQIIHRDLTAKNVLLTSSLVAKITDFGNARIVNLQPGQLARTLSRLPGTLAYMPPEALSANSRYGPSLDIFSFGHLALFTINQVFPGDLLEHNYPDPENPDRLMGRTEVERRGQYFESLEQTMLCGRQYQPLVQLIKDCLHNTPSRRPSTERLLQALEEMKATIEGPYGEFAKMDAVKQVAMVRALKGKDEDVRMKTDALAAKDGEIQQFQVQIQQKNAQIDEINAELRRRNEELQQKDTELQQKDEELHQKDTEYRRSQDSIRQINLEHQRILEEKEACISQLQRQLETLQAGLGVAQRQVQRRDLFSVLERVLVGASPQEQSDSAIILSEIPLRLKWKRGRKMITGMTFYPQAVIFKGKVYVGGGSTSAENIDQYTVVTCYDVELNQWTALPQYTEVFFAMTTINEQLVLIGGRQPHTAKTSNSIGVWSESVRRWTFGVKIPPMCVLQTARDAATAIAYNNRWLIVVGGRDDAYRSLSEVDVIDVTNHQSYSGPPLPQTAHKMSAAVIGNTLVLLGGADSHSMVLNKVFSINLDDLISRAVSFRFANTSTSPWQNLPNTPVVLFTALAFNGNLLAIGGNKHNVIQGDLVNEKYIHLFDPNTQTWVEAGQLLVDRHGCACAVLPTGEMFLAGGSSGPNGRIQEVHIARLQ